MDNHRITREDLQGIASSVFDFLKVKSLNSQADLRKFIEEHPLYGKPTSEGIYIRLRPSNQRTTACVISYFKPVLEIPLEIRLNFPLDYSIVMVKTFFPFSEYEPFSRDSFGNISQYKRLVLADLSLVQFELEAIERGKYF